MRLSSAISFSYLLCVAISFIEFVQTDSKYTKLGSDVISNSINTNIRKITHVNLKTQQKLEHGDNNENMGKSTDNEQKETEGEGTEETNKCRDKYPYCPRYVKIYGLDPPFTLCDKDWFIKDGGKYGCKKSCDLC